MGTRSKIILVLFLKQVEIEFIESMSKCYIYKSYFIFVQKFSWYFFFLAIRVVSLRHVCTVGVQCNFFKVLN